MPEKPEKAEGKGIAVNKLEIGDIFTYLSERYKLDGRDKKKVKVILLTQAEVGETATTTKTIEYGVSRLELPLDTQVLKGKPFPG